MLGDILAALTKAASADSMLAKVGTPEILAQAARDAAAQGVPLGELVASRMRRVLSDADESVWLDILGRISASAQPGAAAIQALLVRAFPMAG